MRFEQAAKFLEIVESGIYDSSRGNIFVHTLNVVKAACLLIELLMAVKHQFGFMERRVHEIKAKVLSIATAYMSKVTSEEEMRYLLLEKDLDNNDALTLIYNFDLIDLLQNPMAQNIVENIWTSPYNNSQSIAVASTLHNLLFNWNDCQNDRENQLRFYRKKNLKQLGCHGF